MKVLKQIGIVFGICWVSVCIEHVLPFSFPASVIGMLLLLALLATGVMKVEHVKDKADFLLNDLPFFFIPITVSIIIHVEVVKSHLAALLVICLVSTVLTFAATVFTVRFVQRLMKRGEKQ